MRVPNWTTLAAFLLDDKDGHLIEKIKRSNHYNVDDCCGEMIREYLKSGNVSWKHVIEALKDASYSNLANDLEEELGAYFLQSCIAIVIIIETAKKYVWSTKIISPKCSLDFPR